MYYVFGVLLAAGVKVVINKTGVAAGRTRNRKKQLSMCRSDAGQLLRTVL